MIEGLEVPLNPDETIDVGSRIAELVAHPEWPLLAGFWVKRMRERARELPFMPTLDGQPMTLDYMRGWLGGALEMFTLPQELVDTGRGASEAIVQQREREIQVKQRQAAEADGAIG